MSSEYKKALEIAEKFLAPYRAPGGYGGSDIDKLYLAEALLAAEEVLKEAERIMSIGCEGWSEEWRNRRKEMVNE